MEVDIVGRSVPVEEDQADTLTPEDKVAELEENLATLQVVLESTLRQLNTSKKTVEQKSNTITKLIEKSENLGKELVLERDMHEITKRELNKLKKTHDKCRPTLDTSTLGNTNASAGMETYPTVTGGQIVGNSKTWNVRSGSYVAGLGRDISDFDGIDCDRVIRGVTSDIDESFNSDGDNDDHRNQRPAVDVFPWKSELSGDARRIEAFLMDEVSGDCSDGRKGPDLMTKNNSPVLVNELNVEDFIIEGSTENEAFQIGKKGVQKMSSDILVESGSSSYYKYINTIDADFDEAMQSVLTAGHGTGNALAFEQDMVIPSQNSLMMYCNTVVANETASTINENAFGIDSLHVSTRMEGQEKSEELVRKEHELTMNKTILQTMQGSEGTQHVFEQEKIIVHSELQGNSTGTNAGGVKANENEDTDMSPRSSCDEIQVRGRTKKTAKRNLLAENVEPVRTNEKTYVRKRFKTVGKGPKTT